LVAGGCARYAPMEPPPGSETITVHVIATQPKNDCAPRFPAQRNACRGVTGETDGLACGAPGDLVVWKAGNEVTGISSIDFVAGNKNVCGRSVRQSDGSFSCVLQPRPPSEGQGLAFKYVVGLTFKGEACKDKVDPYIIVVKR